MRAATTAAAAGPGQGDHPRRGEGGRAAERRGKPQILPVSDSSLVFVQPKQTCGYLTLTQGEGGGAVLLSSLLQTWRRTENEPLCSSVCALTLALSNVSVAVPLNVSLVCGRPDELRLIPPFRWNSPVVFCRSLEKCLAAALRGGNSPVEFGAHRL